MILFNRRARAVNSILMCCGKYETTKGHILSYCTVKGSRNHYTLKWIEGDSNTAYICRPRYILTATRRLLA